MHSGPTLPPTLLRSEDREGADGREVARFLVRALRGEWIPDNPRANADGGQQAHFHPNDARIIVTATAGRKSCLLHSGLSNLSRKRRINWVASYLLDGESRVRGSRRAPSDSALTLGTNLESPYPAPGGLTSLFPASLSTPRPSCVQNPTPKG